jgi:thiamine-phosphate pyrophosphorylase
MTQIYLISPPKIILSEFAVSLKNALSTNFVPVFQLRLKEYQEIEVAKIAKQIQKICKDYNCQLILNDYPNIALSLELDGVHLGKDDAKIAEVRKQVPDSFTIGASCYNSKHRAMQAGEDGANYLAFGAFFPTTTKKIEYYANVELLQWATELLNLPIVAIGGINASNCCDLVANKADFLAIISFVWQHPLGEKVALQQLHSAINNI